MNPADLGSLTGEFTRAFLGIFIASMPFLLLGSLASGLVSIFVTEEDVQRLMPRSKFGAVVVGALLGLFFPVGESGSVPLARRLMRHGMPVPAGVAFLMAAPVLNPVALAVTYAAFGWGRVFVMWAALGVLIACGVGAVFAFHERPADILRPETSTPAAAPSGSVSARLKGALRAAGDDFFDIGRYLVVGALVAALVQMIVSPAALAAEARGAVFSVGMMQWAAFVTPVGGVGDAFTALGFAEMIPTGALVSFLLMSAMTDLKRVVMLAGVFKLKYASYLYLLTFLMVLLAGALINLYAGW